MKASFVLAVLGLAAASNAQSLTTLFASNNGGSAGGNVYFNITVGANAITITGFNTNTSIAAGGSFNFQAWTVAGTYLGNEQNAGAWTQVTTGSGVSAGNDQPSAVTLNNSFTLNANTTYGVALSLSNPIGVGTANHRYTNGTGTNQNFSNADLSIALGAAQNVPFSGSPFTPRVWNGTVFYDVVPTPASAALLGLGGLVATRRRR